MSSPADPAVRDFLRDSMVALVATLSPKGRPFMTPLWFVVAGGTVYVTTGTGTRAARNIIAGSPVALLFTGEHGPQSGHVLRVHGTGTCHAGFPPWPALLRIAAKYYLAPGAAASEHANVARWRLRGRYYAQVAGGAGYLAVRPERAEFLRRP
jgi:hypothetical protein